MLDKVCVFRVDESSDIGRGHFVRCTTIAAQLVAQDIPCVFVVRQLSDDAERTLEKMKIECHRIDGGGPLVEIDDAYRTWQVLQERIFAKHVILVVDSYALGFVWESFLFDKVARLCAIDELDHRMHKSHMVIDQTYGVTAAQYKKILPVTRMHCIGSKYALVRKEFRELRPFCLQQRSTKQFSAENILITMGGSDPSNATTLVLQALKRYERQQSLKLTIVVGELCPHLEAIEEALSELQVAKAKVIVNATNMAVLMSACDICISAAGSTLWELATLGVPTLAMQTADNQRKILANLSADWAVYSLGDVQSLTPSLLITHIEEILNGKVNLSDLSRKIEKVTDGRGVERVVNSLISPFNAQ